MRVCFFIYLGLIFFPIFGISQSVITGKAYYFDSKEPAVGSFISLLDTTGFDSVRVISQPAIIGFYGEYYYGVKDTNEKYLDIEFYPAKVLYRKTVVRNISCCTDTIKLESIPLFIMDEIFGYETIIEHKKYLWGLFKKTNWYSEPMGVEGPFSYKSELYLQCNNTPDSVLFQKVGEHIFVDYNQLKNCNLCEE